MSEQHTSWSESASLFRFTETLQTNSSCSYLNYLMRALYSTCHTAGNSAYHKHISPPIKDCGQENQLRKVQQADYDQWASLEGGGAVTTLGAHTTYRLFPNCGKTLSFITDQLIFICVQRLCKVKAFALSLLLKQ